MFAWKPPLEACYPNELLWSLFLPALRKLPEEEFKFAPLNPSKSLGLKMIVVLSAALLLLLSIIK